MASGELPSFSALIHDNKKEFAILISLGILLCYAFYYYHSQPSSESPLVDESGVIHLKNIRVNDFIENRKGWQLRGKNAVVLEDSKRMRIEKIEISIYVPFTIEEEFPKVDVLISADEGLMEWKDNRVTLLGNVVLKRSDGSLILSDSALYETQKELLTIPEKVRILQEEHTLEGNSMTYEIPIKKMALAEPLLTHYE